MPAFGGDLGYKATRVWTSPDGGGRAWATTHDCPDNKTLGAFQTGILSDMYIFFLSSSCLVH